ncbi:MAG: L,D-transpeptidase family protein [Planctomycetota bacterium]|jgi:hypothetical protein
MHRKTRLFVRIALFTFLIVGAGAAIALTWNSFPGGYLKNRLGIDDGKKDRAKERGEAFRREHPGTASGAPALRISKSRRRIALLVDGKEIWSARVGLGGNPEGHKRKEGDERTPEGDYYVCTRNSRSRFHLFLGISYPGIGDAGQALSEGRITQAGYRRIVQAVRAGACPPWDTALGGAVGIHGSGSNCDWTLGCIALDDPDIEFLWSMCPLGTPVRIDP